MRWHVKKNLVPPESRAPPPAAAPLTFVTDYEALRAAFLASRASSATRLSIQRLIAEGLYIWLQRQSLVRPRKGPRAPPPGSPPLTAGGPDEEALVQLIASMTLSAT